MPPSVRCTLTTQLGGVHVAAGSTLHAYVNDQQVTGNPGAVSFNDHDEIAVV